MNRNSQFVLLALTIIGFTGLLWSVKSECKNQPPQIANFTGLLGTAEEEGNSYGTFDLISLDGSSRTKLVFTPEIFKVGNIKKIGTSGKPVVITGYKALRCNNEYIFVTDMNVIPDTKDK